MFDNLDNTAIGVASEENILAALGTPQKEDKSKTKGKSSSDDKTDNKSKKDTPGTKQVSDISKNDLRTALGTDDDDDDNIEDDDNDEVVEEKPGKGKKKSAKSDKKTKKEESKDVEDQEDNEDSNSDDDPEEEDKDEDKDADDDNTDNKEGKDTDEEENDEEEDGQPTTTDFLKARAELLIKKGEWLPVKDFDDIEWDEDTFADIEIQQRQAARETMREELLDSFGPYGRDIADYSSKGGDPKRLLAIFRQEQQVQSLSVDTEDGQKEVMLKYATEFLDMKPNRAKAYVDNLIADKALEDEATEAKTKMEKALKDEAQFLKDEQDELIEESKQKVKQAQVRQSQQIAETINSADNIPADEKKNLINLLTKFNKKLENGTEVNEFYFKFAEFRKDVKNYVELVRFVLNPDKYRKTAKNEGKTEEANKAFRLIKTGNTTKKTKTSSGVSSKKNTKSSGFQLIY